MENGRGYVWRQRFFKDCRDTEEEEEEYSI
jgi:hypothetical protein